MRKKVVPFQKSTWGDLEDSAMWKLAQEKGQGYLYINGYEEDAYILTDDIHKEDGDFFKKGDFAYLVESMEDTEGLQVGDIIQVGGKRFTIKYDKERDFHLIDNQPIYPFHESVDDLMESFVGDWLLDQNFYLNPLQEDILDMQRDRVIELEEENEELKRKNKELQSQLEQRDADVENMFEILEKFRKDLYNANNRIEELEKSANHATHESDAKDETIKHQDEYIERLERQNERLNKIIDRLL